MSTKVSRRNLIKMLAGAGAAVAALPLIGKVSALPQSSSPATTQRQVAGAFAPQASGLPLVLVVKGNTVTGYRGIQEMSVNDSSLASTLKGTFSSMGGSS